MSPSGHGRHKRIQPPDEQSAGVKDHAGTSQVLRPSEERFRSLVETIGDCVWEVDIGCRFTYISPKIKDLLGYEPSEVLGRTPFDFMPAEEAVRVKDFFTDVVRLQRPIKALEHVALHRDGRQVIIETSGAPVLNGNGGDRPLMYRGVDRDITERKRMEEALVNSEKRFRQLADSALEGLFIYDETGIVLDANLSLLKMSGYSYDEVVGKDVMGFVSPESLEPVRRFMRSHYEGPREVLLRRKDGTPLMIEVHGRPILHEGRRARVVAVRDITERKRMEEALRKSEAMYHMITQNMSDTLWLMDMNLKTIWVSPSVEKKRGYGLAEIQSMPLERQLTPESLRTVLAAASEELTPERLHRRDLEITRNMDLEFCRKDGTTYWSEARFTVIRDREGVPIGVLGVGRDIEERRQAERALRHSEERFSKAFHMSPAPTTINTFDEGRYVDMNDSFLRLLGYGREELVGRRLSELPIWADREEHRALVRRLQTDGWVRGQMLHLLTKNGELKDVLTSCETIMLNDRRFVLSICYDFTEQRRLENQLRRSQKMEAVGTLAGGIAHDFNNILGAVIGYTEIAQREPGLSPRLKRHLEQIHKAGERATHLVHQILTFSRQVEERPQPIRIRPIIKEALHLLRASLPSTIRIHQDIQAEHDMILADPTQIHQIMMNLCTNAAHAMREGKGDLTIRLAPAEVGDRDVRSDSHGLTAGRYLALTVGDTGVGIEPGIIDRIFDPFFTTKKPGEGTGMGLAVVHGIVKNCGGVITVKSEPGQGAEFSVYFPLLPEETEGGAASDAMADVAGGNERLLLVDDEEVLVQVGSEMLAGLGYEVVGRTSSLEALDLFRARPDRFDLVITDLTMPILTGIDLVREIRRIRPGMPVILCSGFNETMTREKALELGVDEFILKPIAYRHIAPAIRRVLDRGIAPPLPGDGIPGTGAGGG